MNNTKIEWTDSTKNLQLVQNMVLV